MHLWNGLKTVSAATVTDVPIGGAAASVIPGSPPRRCNSASTGRAVTQSPLTTVSYSPSSVLATASASPV